MLNSLEWPLIQFAKHKELDIKETETVLKNVLK